VTTYDVRDEAARAPGVDAAVAALRRGDLAVLPTDTVYGLAADAFTPDRGGPAAGRQGPRARPAGARARRGLAHDRRPGRLRQPARPLAGRGVLAGPLTLVVRAAGSLAWDLGQTRGTVAVRMPLHPVALAVLEQTGPLAVSSANRTGSPPAVDAAEALAQLGTSVAVYLDAGPAGDPVPSTIVDLTGERPRVLRAGALAADRIREVAPDLEDPA
jgi:tRNA A37 threonylcarbamoyladenosine synthetase subunit TsaC/SUA5/YrdC